MLKKYGVNLKLNTEVSVQDLESDFDEIVVAAGVRPRKLTIEGFERDNVLSYMEAINNPSKVGHSVAVIGAGGLVLMYQSFYLTVKPWEKTKLKVTQMSGG